jgi:hypothetical protein
MPLRTAAANSLAAMPGVEWSRGLDVSEVTVPFEFSDAGDPSSAEGKKRKDAKPSVDFGADAGDRTGLRKIGGWRRDESEFVDACIGLGRHEARQVWGFAKKRKTRSMGKGTQCSNCAWWVIVLGIVAMRRLKALLPGPVRRA